MLNKMILAAIGAILLAVAIQGCQSANGYLSDIQNAAQQRSAAYANR